MDKQGVKMEYYGHLNKTERLTTLTSKIIPGSLVLEAPEPFAGSLSYYSETPHLSKPLYVYLVLDKSPDLEQIARATEIVHVGFPWEFNAAYAIITINFESFKTIRIRNILRFEHVEAIQNAFIKAGLTMKKSTQSFQGIAQIKLKKLFQLIAYPSGAYLDFDEIDQGYFMVPEQLSSTDFKALIKKVKNNTHFQTYDFAQVFFYSSNKIMDAIRVYHPEMNIDILSEVREAVLTRFGRKTVRM